MRRQDDSHCARGQREKVPGGLDQGGRGVWGEQLHPAEAAAFKDGDRLPIQEREGQADGSRGFHVRKSYHI